MDRERALVIKLRHLNNSNSFILKCPVSSCPVPQEPPSQNRLCNPTLKISLTHNLYLLHTFGFFSSPNTHTYSLPLSSLPTSHSVSPCHTNALTPVSQTSETVNLVSTKNAMRLSYLPSGPQV